MIKEKPLDEVASLYAQFKIEVYKEIQQGKDAEFNDLKTDS